MRLACHDGFAQWRDDLFPPIARFWDFSHGNQVTRIIDELGMKRAARVRLMELAERIGPIVEPDRAFVASLVETLRAADLPELVKDAA
jgi:hypothetical protein